MSRARQLADSADLNFDSGTLVIDSANNNVGIGTATPNSYANQTVLTINGTDYGRLDLEASGTKKGSVFGGGDGLYLDAGVNQVLMFAGGSEAMRIDSSGNLLVGKTTTASTSEGVNLSAPGGASNFVRSGTSTQPVVIFNKQTNDGEILQFRKDNVTVGSIGVANGDNLYIAADDTTDVGLKFDGDANAIYGCTASGSIRDNAITLGDPAVRFKDLYLSGGVYLGGTGAANYLDDYEEGTFTATMVGSTSGSLNANSAEYTKIGNTVHVAMTWNGSIGSATFSGQISINGMPFANGGIIHLLKGNYTRMSWASGDIPVINFGTGATSVSLYSMRSNNTGLAWTAATNFVSGSSMWIRINGSYIATT